MSLARLSAYKPEISRSPQRSGFRELYNECLATVLCIAPSLLPVSSLIRGLGYVSLVKNDVLLFGPYSRKV